MKDCGYLVLIFISLVIVINGQGQKRAYPTGRIQRMPNGELIHIVNNGQRSRNNGNNRNNNNRNSNVKEIVLGTSNSKRQVKNTNVQSRNNVTVVAIIVRNPYMSTLIQNMAATIMSKLKGQDMMFLLAGVDTHETRSTRAMKSMFTSTKSKSMAMGEEERAKTAMVREVAAMTRMRPIDVANSVDPLMEKMGLEMKGLGTKDDNCDEFLDIECDSSALYRTADGSCNNLDKPLWGRAFVPMRRFLKPVYDDEVSAPRTRSVTGGELPSSRRVSLAVHESDSQARPTPTITHMLMQWGQFLDHDITSTPTMSGAESAQVGCCTDDVSDRGRSMIDMRPEDRDLCFPIKIDASDRQFGHRTCLNFIRSIQVSNTNCMLAPAEQMNQITAWIDGSNVYGSTQDEQDDLRTFSGGLLKTSPNDLLPEDNQPSCLKTKRTDFCFKAGDGRVNEQMALATMHTVWMREHNRVARELGELNKNWSDEKLFQESRKIVAAKIQHITYQEFLGAVLDGQHWKQFGIKPRLNGFPNDPYDPKVDGSIRNVFATAAFRFGHSLVRTAFSQMDRDYKKMADLMLVTSFGNTSLIIDDNGSGLNRYVRGLVTDNAGLPDRLMSPMVTQHLFEDGFGHSLDLAALNIQRGRDHGLPSYNAWRKWCSLPEAKTFDKLKDHDANAIRQLRSVYAHPDDIDVFAGGMSETRIKGGLVGPTFACIIAHQFKALKKGDRFFYERKNSDTGFTKDQLKVIKSTTLSKVLCDNTDIDSIQPKAFNTVRNKNQRVKCENLKQSPLGPWSDDPRVRNPRPQRKPNNRQQGGNKKPKDQKRGNKQRKDRKQKDKKEPNKSREIQATEWGPWGSWGTCSNGKRWRRRSCQTNENAKARCVGPSSESEICGDRSTDCSKSIYSVFARFLCDRQK